MHRTGNKIALIMFPGENENFQFSVFDFKDTWTVFLKQN